MTAVTEEILPDVLEKAKLVLESNDVRVALSEAARDYYSKSVLAQQGLLAWFSTPEDPLARKREERLTFTAYYLLIVGVKLRDSNRSLSTEVLGYSAQLFEYVGRYLLSDPVSKLAVLRQGSIAYDLSGYPANTVVLANEMLRLVDASQLPLETIPRFFAQVNLAIITFLARDFVEVISQCDRIQNEKKAFTVTLATIEDIEERKATLVRFLGYLDLIQALRQFALFTREGIEKNAEQSMKLIKETQRVFEAADEAEAYTLAVNLENALATMKKRSVWVVASELKSVLPGYLGQLVNSRPPITELWESQAEAVKHGLLNDAEKRLVISMPTSSGKTLIAELAVADSLARHQGSTAIYVVPSKALALQVEDNLRQRLPSLGFKVSMIVGSYDPPEIQKLKLDNCRVLVTTPEKLSQLEKLEEDVVNQCKLFVFDEAQQIGTMKGRGVEFEFLLARIKRRFNGSKILILSPVMRNTDEIAHWIGDAEAISIDWHPTRTLQAILHDGAVQYYREAQGLTIQMPETKLLSVQEKAVRLAEIYGNIGPTLVFCKSKAIAMKIAGMIYERIRDPPKETQRGYEFLMQLSDQIRSELDEDFPLANYVLKGVAYHHADLPAEVKVKIEQSIRRGFVRYIASTTTLAEGVNTPVSCVIIPYLNFFEMIGSTFRILPLSRMLYRNIAGRSGRALQNTEGHVVLVKPDRTKLADVEQYIESDREDLEPIKSSLFELTKKTLDKEGEYYQEMQLSMQTSVLAALCDGSFKGNNSEELLNQTLFELQCPKESSPYKVVESHVESHLRRMNTLPEVVATKASPYTPTEFGIVCNQIGLSPESCVFMLEEIGRILEKDRSAFRIPLKPDSGVRDRILRVLDLAFTPYEVRNSESFRKTQKHSKVLYDWIFGVDLRSLAERYFLEEGKGDKEKLLVSAYAYVVVQLTYYAPWVLWGLTQLLDYRKVRYSGALALLPRFAKYGVSDLVASQIRSLGVGSRSVAMKLASEYKKTGMEPDFGKLSNWVLGLEQKELKSILADEKITRRTMNDIKEGRRYLSEAAHLAANN